MKKLIMTLATLAAGTMLYAAPAAAQATRTWVSGVGDDANPCSRTAPCKTFPGAISKTAAGGEINCLDPGGFGAVTITKAMTILCDQTEGGILVAGSPAITINAGATDIVTISGLDILGPSPSSGGTNAFNFVNGGGLNIRHVTIKGFNTSAVNFQPQTTSAFLNMNDVIITGNGTNGDTTTTSVRLAPANNVIASVTLDNVRISNSQNSGVRIDLTGTTGNTVNLNVNNSQVTNSGTAFLMKALPGTGTINATLQGVLISGNSGLGISSNGSGVNARVGTSTITVNGAASTLTDTGVRAINSAVLASYGNNILDGNYNSTGTLSNGAFSSVIPLH